LRAPGGRIPRAARRRRFPPERKTGCAPTEFEQPRIELLDRLEVRHLMVVPNQGDHGGRRLTNIRGADLLPLIERRYRLSVKAPKYADAALQRLGVQPTWHYLFERRST